jgi:hypothetical protein
MIPAKRGTVRADGDARRRGGVIRWMAVAAAAATPLQAGAQGAERHPRLFVTPERVEEIRAAVRVPGSHHAEAFDALRARVAQADWRVYAGNPPSGRWNYYRSYLAREAAFLYLLTDERRYAQIAFDALYAVHNDHSPELHLPESSDHGLARAMIGKGMAIAYDWAFHGFTHEQRAYLRERIEVALDAWPAYRHGNLETDHHGSNWVAVTRGGELVMMLAVAQERQREERFRYLKETLEQHMKTAYGPSGWGQEGLGYTSYAGQFLLPAIYALQSIGDPFLNAQFQQKAWYRLVMTTHAFTPQRDRLMSGVDTGFANDHQGWTSLLLGSVPPGSLPCYRHFYDHHMGKHAAGLPSEKYDPLRAGTTWALIYYPESVPDRNPTEVMEGTLFDEKKGAYFFRNRWQDADDVLVSFMGDYTHHGNAWDVREAFQIGVIGFATPFIGGPGTAAAGRDARSDGLSALLVDGRAFVAGSDGRTGSPTYARAAPDGGGYVIVDGGEKFSALGLNDVRRHLRVDFPADGGAFLSTLDRIRAHSQHRYTWQLNPGGARDADRVRVTTGSEAGRPVFTLHGDDDAYLKGWVLHPAGAVIESTDPLRITVHARDTEIWVVMVAGRGTPSRAQIDGAGLRSVVRANGRTVRFDAESERIVAD